MCRKLLTGSFNNRITERASYPHPMWELQSPSSFQCCLCVLLHSNLNVLQRTYVAQHLLKYLDEWMQGSLIFFGIFRLNGLHFLENIVKGTVFSLSKKSVTSMEVPPMRLACVPGGSCVTETGCKAAFKVLTLQWGAGSPPTVKMPKSDRKVNMNTCSFSLDSHISMATRQRMCQFLITRKQS